MEMSAKELGHAREGVPGRGGSCAKALGYEKAHDVAQLDSFLLPYR